MSKAPEQKRKSTVKKVLREKSKVQQARQKHRSSAHVPGERKPPKTAPLPREVEKKLKQLEEGEKVEKEAKVTKKKVTKKAADVVGVKKGEKPPKAVA